jgi:predicted nucleic acid-binding protein
MKVLIDTDVVLDLLLDRQPFVQEAMELWEANRLGRFEGYITSIVPINVFYIIRKLQDIKAARKAVSRLLAAFQVCLVDHSALQIALTLPFTDYEDAVQHASAEANQIEIIVTRNLKDYSNATLTVFVPADFLKHLSKQP